MSTGSGCLDFLRDEATGQTDRLRRTLFLSSLQIRHHTRDVDFLQYRPAVCAPCFSMLRNRWRPAFACPTCSAAERGAKIFRSIAVCRARSCIGGDVQGQPR